MPRETIQGRVTIFTLISQRTSVFSGKICIIQELLKDSHMIFKDFKFFSKKNNNVIYTFKKSTLEMLYPDNSIISIRK